jgi:hypothetical protein
MRKVIDGYIKVFFMTECMKKVLGDMRIDDSENVVFLPDSENVFEVDGDEYYVTVYFGIGGVKVFLNINEEKDDKFPESFLVGKDIPPSRIQEEIENKIKEINNGQD